MSDDEWKMNPFDRREFLRWGAMGALGTLAAPRTTWSQRKARELSLYIGTYTSGKSEGIYHCLMNSKTGELNCISSLKAENPSFLAIDRKRRYLYAVNELKEFSGKPSGGVSAFNIDAKTRKLTLVNQQPSLGADPCHLAVDRTGKFLVVANYTGGNISVLPIQSDGSLGVATDVIHHHGTGIKEQQDGPHPHCVVIDRLNRILVADLGIDKVMIYRLNTKKGKLNRSNPSGVSLNPGAGPRHLTLHPYAPFAYVINELDSTMAAFSYNSVGGSLRAMETTSTLPPDFSAQSYCADLHVSPSGRFLYGSNRGHNSIVSYVIDRRTGRLKPLEHSSTQGKWPRNFVIDPAGRFLLVANQHSDTVVTFRIDSRTGKLSNTGYVAQIPSPVCLKFV